MDNFDIKKYMNVVDNNSDNLSTWNKKVKDLFGEDAYIRKTASVDGVTTYKVYARYYPDAIMSVKGQAENIKSAVEQAERVVEKYRLGESKKIR